MNILLFIFDLLTLPITIVRLFLIFLYGSRYNINGLECLDIMMHAQDKYFNQQNSTITLDTTSDDIRQVINRSSKYLIMDYDQDDLIKRNEENKKYTELMANSMKVMMENIKLMENNKALVENNTRIFEDNKKVAEESRKLLENHTKMISKSINELKEKNDVVIQKLDENNEEKRNDINLPDTLIKKNNLLLKMLTNDDPINTDTDIRYAEDKTDTIGESENTESRLKIIDDAIDNELGSNFS